jgi:hypothetical protein
LNVLQLSALVNVLSNPIKFATWVISSSGTTLLGIVAALAIQVFNYVGLKRQADRYFPLHDAKPDVWFQGKTISANEWFTLAQKSLWISIALSSIGFLLGISLWVKLKWF